MPKSNIPLKVIVLDDTQREDDGSIDIHGHGFLDATRWAWLQAELDDGQRNNQLMIIAAHIPIAVSNIGTMLEWWLGGYDASTNPFGDRSTTAQNAVTIEGLVDKLQNTPNLLMWISGHRHLNHVKAFVSPDPVNEPEKGFWQVETSFAARFSSAVPHLRNLPQQRLQRCYRGGGCGSGFCGGNTGCHIKKDGDCCPADRAREFDGESSQPFEAECCHVADGSDAV